MNHVIKEQLEEINQQLKELMSIYRGAVTHAGISENEFWIWYALIIMEGEYSQQDICAMWSLSKQTVNTIVSHMAQKGYISLKPAPGMRKRKLVCLTEEGRAYGELLVRPISDAEQRAFERVPEVERIVCGKILGNYIRILKEEVYETEMPQGN